MSMGEYARVLREAEHLSPDEQRELVEALLKRLQAQEPTDGDVPRFEDLAGTAPYPLCGEDAQKYVSRMREEWDEREQRP
jgi:hypothetical protein